VFAADTVAGDDAGGRLVGAIHKADPRYKKSADADPPHDMSSTFVGGVASRS